MSTHTELVAPDRSLAQRMNALDRANDVRSARALVKRDIGASRQSALRYVADPPAYMESMKVIDLLLTMPKYGRVKANKILSRTRISPSKTLGGLSARQRVELLSVLPGSSARAEFADRLRAWHESR